MSAISPTGRTVILTEERSNGFCAIYEPSARPSLRPNDQKRLRAACKVGYWLSYARSAIVDPMEFYSCFISYSSEDQEFVERLYADLQNKRVRCWFAPEDLKIGDPFRKRIDEAIRLHDKLLIVLSERSVKSPWVEKEVETAFEKERQQNRVVLFPIRVDDAVIEAKEAWAADIRRARHIGDFRDWKNHDSYKKAFDRLMRDLKSEVKSQSSRSVNLVPAPGVAEGRLLNCQPKLPTEG